MNPQWIPSAMISPCLRFPLIHEWELSGRLEHTHAVDPKPTKDEVVCTWMKNSCQNFKLDPIKICIVHARFLNNFDE